MVRTMIMGYGNLDRADDGVAFYVINALRQRLGQRPLSQDETGLHELGGEIDSVFLRQLLPEWMETASAYDRLIFVDAHVQTIAAEVSCVAVEPEFVPSPFTHHMTPATFLAMSRALYGRGPEGRLLSIRGHDFDFYRGLSAEVSRQVEPAVEILLRLGESEGVVSGAATGAC